MEIFLILCKITIWHKFELVLNYQKILKRQRLWMCQVSDNYPSRERRPPAVSFLKRWLLTEFPTGAAWMKFYNSPRRVTARYAVNESLDFMCLYKQMRYRNQGGIADYIRPYMFAHIGTFLLQKNFMRDRKTKYL